MGDEEIVNQDEFRKEFRKELLFAFKEIQGSSAFSLDRNRPYDGQPQTDMGTRGKTMVSGLTMRDISDCIVRGFLAASACDRKEAGIPERENPCFDDVYQIDGSKLDPGAVIQYSMCEVEKMMGIFPNVPRLEPL
jgi:hypothetical protein